MRVNTGDCLEEKYDFSTNRKFLIGEKTLPFVPAKCNSLLATIAINGEEYEVPFRILSGGMDCFKIPYENENVKCVSVDIAIIDRDVMKDIFYNKVLQHSYLKVPAFINVHLVLKRKEDYSNGVLEYELEKIKDNLKWWVGLDYHKYDVVIHVDKKTEKVTICIDDGYDYDY